MFVRIKLTYILLLISLSLSPLFPPHHTTSSLSRLPKVMSLRKKTKTRNIFLKKFWDYHTRKSQFQLFACLIKAEMVCQHTRVGKSSFYLCSSSPVWTQPATINGKLVRPGPWAGPGWREPVSLWYLILCGWLSKKVQQGSRQVLYSLPSWLWGLSAGVGAEMWPSNPNWSHSHSPQTSESTRGLHIFSDSQPS